MKLFRSLLSNNNGYALITVLLIITIFMIFGFSFMTQSINTTKQTSVIESKIHATDLAEMGAEYYSYVINEEIDIIKNELQEWLVDELIPSYSKEKREKFTKEGFELELTEKVKARAENKISNHSFTLKPKKMDHEDNLTFSIKEIKYDNVDKRIVYSVEGKSKGDTASISSNIHLNIDAISVNTENEYSSWVDIFAPNLDTYEYCGSGTKFTNVNCKFDGKIFTNNNKPIFENSNIIVNGDFTLPNVNQPKLKGTNFYITGDFKNTNNLNNTTNFNMYIEGSARIGNMNNAENVKICVNHLKEYGGTNKGGVTIYAKVSDVTNNDVITDEGEFEKNCLFSSLENSISVQWSNPINKKEYNYNK